jgi:uncharacterized membrane protein YdfJ with MMPL/SSD domain
MPSGLLAADSASLHGLGPVGAVGIVSALLAQTTFLPALLLVTTRINPDGRDNRMRRCAPLAIVEYVRAYGGPW